MSSGYETTVAESELQRGVDSGELVRVYQPIVDVATAEPRYVEALLRWAHRSRGVLTPKAFLGDEEDSTLLIRIGWSVVIEAARRAADWRLRFPDRPITVSVNLSARHLAARDLSSRVEHLLHDNLVSEERVLAFEIAEHNALAHRSRHRDRLFGLRNLGVEIVIDDFGASAAETQVAAHVLRDAAIGQLASLERYPVDVVKLEPRFVARLTSGGGDATYLADVVAAAHDAGLRVVALAVETDADATRAEAAGVDLAQGFHYHRPTPPSSVDRLLGAP